MKKLTMRILPLLLLIGFLSGCSDDDTSPANTVVGTWRLVGTYDYTQDLFVPVDACYQEVTVFQEDGTGTSSFIDCNDDQSGYPFFWETRPDENMYNQTIEDMIFIVNITFENYSKMFMSYNDDNAKVYQRILEE
jgi:hypothetical protein